MGRGWSRVSGDRYVPFGVEEEAFNQGSRVVQILVDGLGVSVDPYWANYSSRGYAVDWTIDFSDTPPIDTRPGGGSSMGVQDMGVRTLVLRLGQFDPDEIPEEEMDQIIREAAADAGIDWYRVVIATGTEGRLLAHLKDDPSAEKPEPKRAARQAVQFVDAFKRRVLQA